MERPAGGSVRRKSSGLLTTLGRAAPAGPSAPVATAPAPSPVPEQPVVPPLPGPAGVADVRALLAKRQKTWAYLRRANEGQVHWFNTSLLQRGDLDAAVAAGKVGGVPLRSARFAVLGLSLASLLDMSSASSTDLMRGLLAVSLEFDALAEDATLRPKARSLFRPARGPRRSGAGQELNGTDGGDYSYLIVPNMPFEPDYLETLYTLCDILVDTYARLLTCLGPAGPPHASAVASAQTVDVVVRIDAKLKKLIWPITKELDALARSIISSELSSLADDGVGGDWGVVDA